MKENKKNKFVYIGVCFLLIAVICFGIFHYATDFWKTRTINNFKVANSEFKSGKKLKGKLEISEERRYIGEFNNDKIEGKGTFFFTDKKYCQGTWENNELNGLAIYYREDKIHKGKIIKI